MQKLKQINMFLLITYKDKVAPTIANVEAKTSGDIATSLTIKASEPLKADIGLVKVNGAYVEANFTMEQTRGQFQVFHLKLEKHTQLN